MEYEPLPAEAAADLLSLKLTSMGCMLFSEGEPEQADKRQSARERDSDPDNIP
jgi:hypothetical protein